MVIKAVVWCLFIPLFLSGIRSSPTDRDLYVFKTVANADFSDEVRDSETAETNTYSNPYSGSTNDASEDSSEDPSGPPDHVIPYSEHEDPGEVATRPKYVAPGTWAKPDPKKKIPLDFVPTKSLAQVRGTHTVRVLPQSEAIAAASSAEERENAPRLRQVVSKKKTNTIYTEEGYEDSAYDHAGHIRDADFHEGYARKLHDQRQSEGRSGTAAKKKKSKRGRSRNRNRAPEPDEFEEFMDDYSEEHATPNEKYEVEESKRTGKKDASEIHGDAWKDPEISPKIVAENEILKLEDDLRREDEEAEKGSENYASVTDRELLRIDENQDSFEERDETKARPPSSKRQENFYKEDYEATTIQFETPSPRESEQYETSTLNYENPTTLKFYVPEVSNLRQDYDTSTLDYENSNNQQLVNTNVPSMSNYGEIFWNYYKTKSNEPTTPYPQKENSPVALATINGHGPYLLLSENGAVTQNPSQFEIEGTTYYPTMQSVVQNGHQYIDPFVVSNSKLANARSGYEFPGFGDSSEPATSSFDNWGLKSSLEIPILSTESSTARFYDNIAFSSTPAYSVINLPSNEYGSLERTTSERSSYRREKPLVNSMRETVGNVNGYERENFSVSGQNNWPATDNNPVIRKGKINSPNLETGVEKSLGFFNYSPNLKYTKILNYIKNQQNDKYDGQKSESAEAEDFTIMKPPTPSETVLSDFTPSSYLNVADYSSVNHESGAAREINGKQFYPRKNVPKYNDLSQKGIHLKSRKFHGDNPQQAVLNRKKLFPPSKLLPPAPNSKDNYADFTPIRQPSLEYESKFANGVKNYNPDPKYLARYFNNRRIPPRYRRSLNEAVFNEEKIADAVIAQEINARFNSASEDQGSTQIHAFKESQITKARVKRNPTLDGGQLKENSSPAEGEIFSNKNNENSATISEIETNRSLRGKRSHQDLLDASQKIAGDVVDEEINLRFREKSPKAAGGDLEEEGGEEEEEEEEEKEENEDEEEEEHRGKQVEVEVPDFDYLDEIKDVNNIDDIPATPATSIDPRKYPFYNNNKVNNASPLKYVINPSEVPRKTFGGMEFYESRDRYLQCDEVDPDLDEVLPEEEEPVPNRGPKENLPRLRGLGDKLDCFKAKYFGKNPFDSPLFFEKRIDQPIAPAELDPTKFAARILALPEENLKYFVPAQTKRTEATTIERMNSGRRQKGRQNFAETSKVQPSIASRGKKRFNNNYDRSRGPSTQKPKSQSQRGRQRRPVRKLPSANATEATAVKPVTPYYEKEVYDDVMGTIKNLASLYEMIESQTVAPATETTIVSPNSGRISGPSNIRNGKTSNRAPPLSATRGKNLFSSDAAETASYEEIEGLLPPPELNMKSKLLPYRTNKVSYSTRARVENPPRNNDRKIIGYYRTVKVHKRSLDGDSDARSSAETARSQRAANKWDVSDSEFQESQVNYRTASPDVSSSPTTGTNRKRKRKNNLATTTTTTASSVSIETPSEAQNGRSKSIYTIKTRSKNSRDEKTRDKYGVFTSTQRTTSTIDGRRKEPRYREIMRRRGQTSTTTTTASPQELKGVDSTEPIVNPEVIESFIDQVTEPGEIYESDHSVPRRRKVSIVDPDVSGEVYKAIASELESEDAEEDDEDLENHEEESTEVPKKKQQKYDVHEDVQEETTPSTIGFSSPVKTSGHVDLETFLSTDPPGFRDAFADLPTTKTPYVSADNSEEVSKEEQSEDDDEEYYTLAPQKDFYRKEESSEEDDIESPKISESYKPSSSKNVDKSADEKKNPENEDTDVGTFFNFNARPDSPFENYEDKKYSDIGPRINKPAFYHPHFEPEKYKEYSFDDSEKDEEKEKDKTEESLENEKYEFPWAHDEEDEKAEAREKYVDEATEKYEYPWEKRERLAEERKKRRKDNERLKKLRDFSFFDDTDGYEEDEDETKPSSSETNKKVVYPWQYYDDIPSKAKKKTSWKSGGVDNEGMSSNHRPVAKFSSKYSSSKFKLPYQDSEPIAVADPKAIRKSVLNSLRDADEKYFGSTYETDISKSPKASEESDQVIKRPNEAEKEVSASELPSSEPRNKKRISNSRIVPENITSAPRNANRSSVIPLRDRTTLRPSVKSTNETTASLRIQTTVTPITTTRKPFKLRGRTNIIGQQSSYAAEEHRVATSTAPPTLLVPTTEKPVKTGKKKSGHVFIRKRGYLKNSVSTPGSNAAIKSNGQSSEDVTQRSQPGTTTVRRRKLPTVTTSTPIKKTILKDVERVKRPPTLGSKNLVKETTYDAYRIPTMSLGNSKDRGMDNATPSRTVEHRSRVSKEEIITKTSFPDENPMYKIYRNKNTTEKSSPSDTDENSESSIDRKPKITYSKTPDRGRNLFDTITDSPDEKSARDESSKKFLSTVEETSEPVYQTTETLFNDDFKGMFDSVTSENHTVGPTESEDELHTEKSPVEELEKIMENFDEIKTQSGESKEEVRSSSAEDTSTLSQVPSKSPQGSNELKESDDSSEESVTSEENSSTESGEERYGNEYEDSDESEEDESSEEENSFVTKFEKDPSRRLYYFLEDKK